MHMALAVCGHRWAAPIALVVGLVAFFTGIAVGGEVGDDVRSVGALLAIASVVRIGHTAAADRSRATHRFLRCELQRTDLVSTLPRSGDVD